MMNARHAIVVAAFGCLTLSTVRAQTSPTCPKGFQPYANRCISQRMADYISCVEASGGNSQRIATEVTNANAGKTDVGVKGSGSGVVAKGSGSVTVDRATEQALASKFEHTWTDKGMEECRKVLDPPKPRRTRDSVKGLTIPQITVEGTVAYKARIPAGHVYYLDLQETPGVRVTDEISTTSGDPGKIFSGNDADGMPAKVHVYRFTNYGALAMLNVGVVLHVTFYEAFRKDHQITSGGITSELNWKVRIPKIDPGPERAFALYAMSMSNRFVRIEFPDKATVNFAGKSSDDAVKLVQIGPSLEKDFLAPVLSSAATGNRPDCTVTNSTTSNGVYRNGAIPDLAGQCDSRFTNNLIQNQTEADRPKLIIGGKQNDIGHNTFPIMDVATTDTSQGNRLHDSTFQDSGQTPNKNGDGADMEAIRKAQTRTQYPGGFPDVPQPIANAVLNGTNSSVADQLAQFIDNANNLIADFLKDDNAQLISEREQAWEAETSVALVADLGPRFGQAFDEAESTSTTYPVGHNAKGGSICNLIDVKVAVLKAFVNQLRAANNNSK